MSVAYRRAAKSMRLSASATSSQQPSQSFTTWTGSSSADEACPRQRRTRRLPGYVRRISFRSAAADKCFAQNELVLALYEMGQSYRFGLGVEKNKKMVRSSYFIDASLLPADSAPRRPSPTSNSPPTSATSMHNKTSPSVSQTAKVARRTRSLRRAITGLRLPRARATLG